MREYWIKILLRSVKIIDENTFIAEVSSEPRLEEDGYMHVQVVEDAQNPRVEITVSEVRDGSE